jgi:phenylacetate-CoA ligase
MAVPDEWRARAPAMTDAGFCGLDKVLQHPDAPRWNRRLGDRVDGPALEELDRFRELLRKPTTPTASRPHGEIITFVEALRSRLFLLDDLPRGFDVARDFEDLPTTDRTMIVERIEDLVPRDASLEEAIVYSTSSTTGHAVIVPSHPIAMVKNLAHLEVAMRLHGVTLHPTEGVPHALNMSAQQRTYVFATTMSGWAGAVFAKVNLSPHDWAGGASACARFIRDFNPLFIASEPVTLAEAMAIDLPIQPKVVVSSAVHLNATAADRVAKHWGCAVIDLYSTTETGPIAVSVPGVEGHAVLLPDVFVEALDSDGRRVPDGERGEITITGGRNPMLPLIRYRTGDHGRMGTIRVGHDREVRVIRDLEGRTPVNFFAHDGSRIGSVDIARRIRPLGSFVQHVLHQREDGSVALTLRPFVGVPIPVDDFEFALRDLFGVATKVTVELDPELGKQGGKVVAWRSDIAQ